MTLRGWLGLAAVATYLGILVHTTAATQCPLRQSGPCARVHELMLQARAPAPRAVTIVQPMRAARGGAATARDLLLLARR